MIKRLKSGQPGTVKAERAAEVRRTVEGFLADVGARGDAAVREYSECFDRWTPAQFRLMDSLVEDMVRSLPFQVRTDNEFARRQIRNFAQLQRKTLVDLEVETLPGVVLGHRHIPVGSVGCYVPGGRYPMVACAHMSVVTAKAAGARRVVACAPPTSGSPHPATVAAMWPGHRAREAPAETG